MHQQRSSGKYCNILSMRTVIEVKAAKVGPFLIVEKLSDNPGKSFPSVLQGVNTSDIK